MSIPRVKRSALDFLVRTNRGLQNGKEIRVVGECTGRNKISASSIPEVMKYFVSVRLEHLSVNVETREAHFSNFAGQKLNSVHRVAEDY